MSTLSRTSYRRQRKLRLGPVIKTVEDLMHAASKGSWIFFGTKRDHRAYHAQWILNMNFSCVMRYLKHENLFLAIRNPEHPYVFKCGEWDDGKFTLKCSEIPHAPCIADSKEHAIVMAKGIVRLHVRRTDARVQVKFVKEIVW